MSLRHVKEQVALLRYEIGQQGGREWLTVKVPVGFTDEQIAGWLVEAVGSEWRRHVVVRMECASIAAPFIVTRIPVAETPGFDALRFTAEETALL